MRSLKTRVTTMSKPSAPADGVQSGRSTYALPNGFTRVRGPDADSMSKRFVPQNVTVIDRSVYDVLMSTPVGASSCHCKSGRGKETVASRPGGYRLM